MDTIRTILELIYFVSGPILVVIGIIALKQIKEARNQVAETRNSRVLTTKRDSYKAAADKCSYYMETIIPLLNTLDKEIEEWELPMMSVETSGLSMNCKMPFMRGFAAASCTAW